MDLFKLIFLSVLFFLNNTILANEFSWYSILKTEKIDTLKNDVIISHLKIDDIHNLKFGLDVVIFKAPINNVDIKIVPVQKQKNIIEFYKNSNDSAIFMCNGGYFGYNKRGDYIPLGYLVYNYKKLYSPMNWKSSRVLIIRKYLKSIIHMNQIKNYDDIKYAIQSYPVLVENGDNMIKSDNKKFKNRSAVGIDDFGNIIFVIIVNNKREGVSLYELADFLLSKKEENGLNVRTAFALDGGSSSVCYVKSQNLFLGNKLYYYISNVIKIY